MGNGIANEDGRLGYIPAVDGLRALAVVSVIVFHLWPRALPGGFTGVDIFFVISGFVVTGSMLGRRFDSLGAMLAFFYARRLMRIMPALAAMLLAAILAANLFIPDAWLSRAVAEAGIAAFFGASNVVLAVDADTYFGPQAAFNPFTHTWSLGVEEQFYLLFPFLLHWHARASSAGSERRILWLVGALSLGSLAVAAALSGEAHGFAFYLIFPRFWELGVGMLLCLTATRWMPRLAALGNLGRTGLIGGSLALVAIAFAIPESKLFPFPLALLPVTGAAGLIACVCAFPQSKIARLFAARPVVTIGKLSYSLYLWHWPVFVIFRWTTGLDTLALQLTALAIGVALAVVSYYLVEQPLRQSKRIATMPKGKVVRRALAGVVIAGLAGTGLFAAHDRISLSVTRDRAAWYADPDRPLDPARTRCAENGSEAKFAGGGRRFEHVPEGCPPGFRLFVPGDSHGMAIAPALKQLAADRGIAVRRYFRSGCPYMPLIQTLASRPRCTGYYEGVVEDIRTSAKPGDVVFLPGLRLARMTNQFEGDPDVARWQGDHVPPEAIAEAQALLARLTSTGVQVVIEAPKPLFPSPAFRCSDWFNRDNPACRPGLEMVREEMLERRREVLRAMSGLAAGNPAVTIWDPLPVLCPGERCTALRDGQPLYFDGDHLSGHGNDMVYPALRDAVLAVGKR